VKVDKKALALAEKKAAIEEERIKKLEFKVRMRKALDHHITIAFMTLLTIYALIFDDIRILSFNKAYDEIFYGLTAAAVVIFFIEMALSCYSLPQYFNSFFFWLDFISILSMVPDIGWISENLIESQDDQIGATDIVQYSRAGRTTRIIRVIRLIRLLRIMKLYKQTVLA